MVREVREFARLQRRVQSGAEEALWQQLRGRRFNGLKFKRQEPIGPYTADFLCFERKLIVEVDGAQHQAAKAYDAVRTVEIERMGFAVVRFTNDQLLNDLDMVLQIISEAAQLVGVSALTPDPSPKRRGGSARYERCARSPRDCSICPIESPRKPTSEPTQL